MGVLKAFLQTVKRVERFADTPIHLHPPKHHGRLALPLPRAGRFFAGWDRARAGLDYASHVATRIVETSDSRQTEALGAELAASLKRGDVVLVRGELGSGKTTLVRGAARALGVTDPVTSPNVLNRSPLPRRRGDRLPPRPLPAVRTSRGGARLARGLSRARAYRLRGVARPGQSRAPRRPPARHAHPPRRRRAAHRGLRGRRRSTPLLETSRAPT